VKSYGVQLTDVFETLQVYLGSLYVNDFNRFGARIRSTHKRNRSSACSLNRSAGSRRAMREATWCRWDRW
jgi:multidrug efflux pump subunit AcrB